MVELLKQQRGGNRHPLSVRSFILNHLAIGEDYISAMHRAYKEKLDRLAKENGHHGAYHKPRYQSFLMQVQHLTREGKIEFSGREEECNKDQFQGWEVKPVRRYYRLK